jgi:hypothetical protein
MTASSIAMGMMRGTPGSAAVLTPAHLGYQHAVSAPFALPNVDTSSVFVNPYASMGMGMSGFKPAPPSAPASSSAKLDVLDPNNDASLWIEFKSDEGRRYWHNATSMVSTYDKPFCLKSPAERAIPPCVWKEYYADGKAYYSNGKESR